MHLSSSALLVDLDYCTKTSRKWSKRGPFRLKIVERDLVEWDRNEKKIKRFKLGIIEVVLKLTNKVNIVQNGRN